MTNPRLYTAADVLEMDSDAPYDLIDGRLVEVPFADGCSSEIAVGFAVALRAFVHRHRLWRLTGADGGYVLARDPDTVMAPDAGFIAIAHIPNGLPADDVVQRAPTLAVEVLSGWDSMEAYELRARRFLDAGTRLVWVARPDRRAVIVFAPGRDPVELGEGDVLDGEDVLPGFRLPVAEVFADTMAS